MDILEKYVDYAQEGTDAPTKYHKYCAAALVGTIMGRRLWFQLGHRVIYPHLWVCLIGQSTLMKKTTSIGIAEYILSRVNAELMLPAKFTTEKLYIALSEKPVGLVTYGELGSLLSMMEREYNVELKATLTDFYDSPPCRTYSSMKGGMVSVQNPAMTILAGSTMDWLLEAAKTRDIAGGFYPRWLFSVAKSSDREDMPIPPPRNEQKANSIITHLAEILRTYRFETHNDGHMKFSEQAAKEYVLIYKELKSKYAADPLLGAFAGRAQTNIVKLGMISAMARRRATMIGTQDIQWAYEIVKESMHDVHDLVAYDMGDNKTDQHLNKLRKAIKSAGIEGITRRDLLRVSPIKMPDYFDKLLHAILENGWAEQIPGKRSDSYVIVSKEIPADVN